ncbi:MAG: shikimate dehydrogenase [Myxococcales bacterium]|nr:shikimate dehydrogenase [Myxococcales bacterium]MCB9751851.1 shikimate dehydrogenase [Myxococcales bacterium]
MSEEALPRVFGVLGDPIGHSRSPAMHNAAFAALGVAHRYAAFHVRPEALAGALAGARALGLGGLNLTVPHKRAALTLVDELTTRARRIGAVNTVVPLPGGRLRGDNTDGLGFAAAVRELAPAVAVREAVVLGGGGAARAVVDALIHDHEHQLSVDHVRWVTRSPAALAEEVALEVAEDVEVQGYAQLVGPRALARVDLLVNCTSVGMPGGPARFPVALALARLPAGARVVDIVYPRRPGGLLDEAEAAGCPAQDGLPMLLWQGVFALERWLGLADGSLPAPAIAAMRAALRSSG